MCGLIYQCSCQLGRFQNGTTTMYALLRGLCPGPGYGFYIASNLFERGSLREALAAPHAPELLWYKR